MKRRRDRHVSKDDGLTVSQPNTRLKKKISLNIRRVNSELIPIDLIIDILSRLPTKSIARCRCVSKLWASTLRLSCFTELFLTRSSSRPRLLISCHKTGDLFSAPQQVQNLSFVTASYHMKLPFNIAGSFDHFRGFMCYSKIRNLRGKKPREMVSVIYNPTMRESLNLPIVETRYNSAKSFLGYDPIGKQFKVLSITWSYCRRNGFFEELQVLTLGTATNQWRRIECCIPHYAWGKAICIDGGLYYHPHVAYNGLDELGKIVCFDVRYEKFRFINGPKDPFSWLCHSTLVNYKGKLGLLVPYEFKNLTRQSKYFELWVLVDAEKHEWSKHVYVLPCSWKKVVASNVVLNFVGVIDGTSEILLAPTYQHTYRFYVYYYNLEEGTIRRVEIQGMDVVKDHKVDTFLDYIEDVKLLQMV